VQRSLANSPETSGRVGAKLWDAQKRLKEVKRPLDALATLPRKHIRDAFPVKLDALTHPSVEQELGFQHEALVVDAPDCSTFQVSHLCARQGRASLGAPKIAQHVPGWKARGAESPACCPA
jgi:hypothetical protein